MVNVLLVINFLCTPPTCSGGPVWPPVVLCAAGRLRVEPFRPCFADRRRNETPAAAAGSEMMSAGKRGLHNVDRRLPGACLVVVLAMCPLRASGATEPARDNASATLCGIVETSAKSEGLPVGFFTRLIWRESSFRPNAVSPGGAMGVAQFMPGTASARGLVDPFDPAAAIPKSAKLLANLAQRFGNLGLAAAAYNAGPNALANWLGGNGSLSSETQDYVRAITGHDVEEWRGEKPPSAAVPEPDAPCLALIRKLRVARGPAAATAVSRLFAPWGVQVAGSFSKAAALGAFARSEHAYASIIGGMTPLVLVDRRSMH